MERQNKLQERKETQEWVNQRWLRNWWILDELKLVSQFQPASSSKASLQLDGFTSCLEVKSSLSVFNEEFLDIDATVDESFQVELKMTIDVAESVLTLLMF